MIQPGELDLGRAVSDGVASLFRNLLPVIGATILTGVVYFLSICTCLGWIISLPVVMWGWYRLLLDMVDGRAEMSAYWSGVDDLGSTFLRMWAIVLIYFVLLLPSLAVIVPISIWPVIQGETPDPWLSTLGPLIPATLYGLFLVRFMFAPYLVVERRSTPWDAFVASWDATRGKWLRMAALQVLFVLLSAPAQVLNVGSQLLSRDLQANPNAIGDLFGPIMAMQLGVIVISAVAGVLGMAIFTAAYRQVMGKPT